MVFPASIVGSSICELESSSSCMLIIIPLSGVDASIWVVIVTEAMHFILFPTPLIILLACWTFKLVRKDEFPIALLYLDALDDLPVPLISYSIQILESSIPDYFKGLWLWLRLFGGFLRSLGIFLRAHCITASIISIKIYRIKAQLISEYSPQSPSAFPSAPTSPSLQLQRVRVSLQSQL